MRRERRDHASAQPLLLPIVGIVLSICASRFLFGGAGVPAPPDPQVAPDFSRPDLNHGEIRLKTYRGKIVLLNFWATWCEPCLSEVPRFAEWQGTYGRHGLQIVGVSMDDDEAPVRKAYEKYRLNYPVVMGDEKLAELYGGVLGLPLTLLIDAGGKIRYRHEGATDLDVLEREIRDLLPRRPSDRGASLQENEMGRREKGAGTSPAHTHAVIGEVTACRTPRCYSSTGRSPS
jgi:cytochrome c biogenesis protein CcmG/thiol:disulfide interchange protein DsbE